MERRVLIVESQNDFALTLASVLKHAGYSTSLAGSSADAQRELEKRRPDLVVLRAELPDQSGFVLCGNIRKGRFGSNLPVILVSSDVAPEALQQHAQSANAANGYLAIPFEMGELTRLTQTIVPPQAAQPGATQSDGDEMEQSLDSALSGKGPRTDELPAAVPPPLKAAPAGGPPRLPRRERRSALTDEDKAFLDRAFVSIADRKAELLAESREVRRSAPRREMMSGPEAKIQILRDELKVREAQIARISEIWSVRERELLSVEDRLNEKDVEIQGLKIQLDDLGRRLNESQNTLVEKEREHGRQVEDLLLQKFIGEKEVIEVVSAKEKDINMLRREISAKEEELARRAAELETSRKDYEALEKDFGVATLEFEVKEKQLVDTVAAREGSITQLRAEAESAHALQEKTAAERDQKFAEYEGQLKALTETLDRTQAERDSSVADLESRLRVAEEHARRSDAEIDRLRAELADVGTRSAERVGDLEGELAALKGHLEQLAAEKKESDEALTAKVAERDGRIQALEGELADTVERKDRQEADLQAQIQEKLERIGELEGEVEAAKSALADREAELTAELGDLGANAEKLSVSLGETQKALLETQQRLNDTEAGLEGRGNELAQMRADRDEKQGQMMSARNEIQRVTELFRQSEAAKAQLEEHLSAELGGLRTALSEAQGNYEAEAQAHQSLQAETSDVIARLTGERNTTREQAQDLADQLAATKQELGARVADLTQLNARLAHAEDAKSHLEERLGTQTNEAQRREELLQNDLATKSKELADTLRKLSTLQQDKARQADALTREATQKTEQARALEAKLKALFDESKKKTEELSHRAQGLGAELEAARKELAEKDQALAKAGEHQQHAAAERDQVRSQMQSQLQQLNARLQETANALTQERANTKKHAEEAAAKVQRAEARIAQAQQEAQAKAGEMEGRLKEAQSQTAQRQRRVAELEQALEGASATKARAEKELTARIQAAEQKANDAAARLQGALAERKQLEARHLKDAEDVHAKQKTELERRDQVKAQEVKRLQEAVQEKSKQLKVVELELARYKNKPATTTRPAVSSPSSPGARGVPSPLAAAVEEEATKVNQVERAAPAHAPRSAALPARPATAAKGVAITAAPAQKRPAGEDRTVVMPQKAPPKEGDDETDFTSIIDNLGD